MSWNNATSAHSHYVPLGLMLLYFCEPVEFDIISLVKISYLTYTIHAITNCISNERMLLN